MTLFLHQVQGMDLVKHDEPAYPAESWEEQQYWDHQVYRLVHLLDAVSAASRNSVGASTYQQQQQPMITAVDVECLPDEASTRTSSSLPPQMNFAHLVLTDHFQRCVLSLDNGRLPIFKWKPKTSSNLI